MKRLPAALLKSLTHDRGSEMAWHPDLAPGPGTALENRHPVPRPACPPACAPPGRFLRNRLPGNAWQRGSNENTNGLLRQFMPRGADLSDATQTRLNDVTNLMNTRPRRTLGWRTSTDAMLNEIAAFKSTAALDV